MKDNRTTKGVKTKSCLCLSMRKSLSMLTKNLPQRETQKNCQVILKREKRD